MPAPLVGRDSLLAELDEVLADVRAGHGRLVLLTGEAGLGKTRLAEEVARRAEGFVTHWAWCRTEQSAGSLRTWSTLVRALTHSSAEVAALVEQSPALHALVAGTTDGAAPHLEVGRSLLALDLAEALRLGATTARLVVLDDLHDAEASSLRLLVDLHAGLRSTPVLVLATARDTGWEGRETLRAELLRQAENLPLAPLSLADVAALVGEERAAEVSSRTGGNPLLVSELARAADALPASLRALVAGRLAELEEPVREVLRHAAVLGPRFRLDVLAEVADVPLQEIARHLPADLVTSTDPGEARFTHELVRDAVNAAIPDEQLRASHARAGGVLDRLRARGRMVAAPEVARHLLQAGPEHRELAAQRCLDAAASAAQMQAYEDALRWYGEADPLLDDPRQRAEMRLATGRLRRAAGDRDGSRSDLLEAGSLAQQAKEPTLLARAALALGSGPGGFEVDLQDSAQLALLEESLRALPSDATALRATVLARLSVARTFLETGQERLATATEAVTLARDSADPVALGGALAALCDALAGPDHVGDRLAHATEVVDLAQGAGDVDLELLGRRLRLVALLEQGDRPGAEREAVAYALRADQVRHPLYQWYPHLWEGLWALAEGRLADAREANELVMLLGAGSENALVLGMTQRWVLLEQSGDHDGIRELFARILETNQLGTWVTVAFALAEASRGDTAAARARLDTLTDLPARLPRDSEWLATLAQAATATHLVGGHPLAPVLYDALLPCADLWVVEGIGAALRGPAHRFLALVAPDPAAAAHHREQAVLRCRALGATALLDEEPARPAPQLRGGGRLVREGDVWELSLDDRTVRIKDSKGVRDLTALLARPGQEVAALDLYGGPVEHDTGEVLDATARAAYKRRLAELEEQPSMSEAEATEREMLLHQLAQAYGLGGRARRTGSSAERARSAVTARLRETVRRVAELDPELGRHLTNSVRTGAFCSYQPERPVGWSLTT